MAEQMSRRALLTGTFGGTDADDAAAAPSGESGGGREPRGPRAGKALSAKQRAELDDVLEQMNGPTGFEDLEARKS